MNRRLDETFHIPTPEQYDDVIAHVDEEIQVSESAAHFLGQFVLNRRDGEMFNNRLRYRQALNAMKLEPRDVENRLRDRRHTLANRILSGMMFGNIVNERLYPELLERGAYDRFAYNVSLIEDPEAYMAAGGTTKLEGAIMGYEDTAGYMLRHLSNQSIRSITQWGESMTVPGARDFALGFGISMYQVWDTYTDQMMADGRTESWAFTRESETDDALLEP